MGVPPEPALGVSATSRIRKTMNRGVKWGAYGFCRSTIDANEKPAAESNLGLRCQHTGYGPGRGASARPPGRAGARGASVPGAGGRRAGNAARREACPG